MVWTFGKLQEGFRVADLTPENMPGALQNELGRCLHVPDESHANGLQLTMWDCGQHLNQVLWVQEKGITVDRRYFFFKSRMTRKCFAVHAGEKQDGAAVVQWQCGGEPQGHNFHWTWEMGSQLVNRESGKCLHAGADRNAPATVTTCAKLVVPANNLWVFMKPGGETYR
jgi:ricin-type beta-trefoil lectin protein